MKSLKENGCKVCSCYKNTTGTRQRSLGGCGLFVESGNRTIACINKKDCRLSYGYNKLIIGFYHQSF
nr:hypothetical protein [uncultured Desulfobacter sp.]